MKIPANGFTHAGKFHADDVFATALLQILRPDIKITRGFVVPDGFDGIVYDVGYGMFDHHQEPREYRANGVPYAAFGLLWRDEKVQQAYKNSRDGIVVLPCYLPWKNGLYKTDALFVVYPSQRGGWSAQCVTDHKTKRPKLPFPQSWAGQPQEVIEQKSGIPGISFCHASRFLITAKDKETALAACRQVLKNNGRI